jgi:hypothetical protein
MNNIDKLMTKTIKVMIPEKPSEFEEQFEIEIKKLPFDKIGLLNFSKHDADLPANELMQKMKPLFMECLSVSEEELNLISIDYIMEIMEIILRIHTPSQKKSGAELVEEFKRG